MVRQHNATKEFNAIIMLLQHFRKVAVSELHLIACLLAC